MSARRSVGTKKITKKRHKKYIIVGRLLAAVVWFENVSQLARCERAYPLGCSKEPTSYYDYDNYPFPPPGVSIRSTDDYRLMRRMGTGKFSDVFEAVGGIMQEKVVLKCLKPVSDRKIKRELLVLSHASNLPNLARLKGVVVPHKNFAPSSAKLHSMPSLVLQHAGIHCQWLCHGRFHDDLTNNVYCVEQDANLSEMEIKYFLYHLLIALDALHSRGIMHRDIKPRNVLINRRTTFRQDNKVLPLMLIDLGLADFFLPDTRYNVRVASRHYKSPELLIGYEYYDYAIDIWGVGCILVGLLLRREPFFRGKDNVDQLGKIISVLGTTDLMLCVHKYNVDLSPQVRKVIAKQAMRGWSSRKPWLSFLKDCPIPSQAGLDLLDKLLVYDHDIRLTAKEAMQHEFFDSVRNRVTIEVLQRGVPKEGVEPISSSQQPRTSYDSPCSSNAVNGGGSLSQ